LTFRTRLFRVLARVVIHTVSGLAADIYYFRVSAYSILESEYSNSGIVNAVTGYDAYSFVSADVSATVDLVWNVDNSTDVSYITISSKTGISELDISGGVDYYIRTDADDITYYANDHRFFKLGYRQFERPDIVGRFFHERRCCVPRIHL
jgi:hypothetical protein